MKEMNFAVFILIFLSSLDVCISGSWLSVGDWGPKHWIHEWCMWLGICSEVCYGDLGCFDDQLQCHQDFYPPMSPEEIQTTFILHTRKTRRQQTHEIISRFNKSSLRKSTFRSRSKTVFVIHGWGENAERAWVVAMKDALLKKDKMNVFVVDWSEGADEINYWKCGQNIRVVGRQVAVFISFLSEEVGLDISTVHLIGHSLGAHAAGYAGEHLNGEVGRITALDAAGPSFESTPPACRLDQTDALFVDAIHTDITSNITMGVGISEPIGHVDFYPNGGFNQPGCYWFQLTCSHARSHLYFTESLRSKRCQFKGVACPNNTRFENGECAKCKSNACAYMGYDAAETGARGTFYLATKKSEPFCAKKKNYLKLLRRWERTGNYITIENVKKR